MDAAGALRGRAQRRGALSPRCLHRGPHSLRSAQAGGGAARPDPVRQRREHEGRLPACARPAARRRAPAGHPLRTGGTTAKSAVRLDRDRIARPRHRREYGDLLVRRRHPAAAAAGAGAGASRHLRADIPRRAHRCRVAFEHHRRSRRGDLLHSRESSAGSRGRSTCRPANDGRWVERRAGDGPVLPHAWSNPGYRPIAD